MTRKKAELPRLESWGQVDEALKEIGRLDREVNALETGLNEQIDYLKERIKEAVQPKLYERDHLELQLKEYCEVHREEMEGKTRKLNFGSVSFRLSSRVIIRGVENCLAALEARGLTQCILVKKSPNKEEMKKLDDVTLAEVGARRESKDVFGYEVDVEKVESGT